MNTFKLGGYLAALCLLLVGCVSTPPQKTSLQLQAIQSQNFETDKSVAFAATLSVFQDLGYIIQSADKDTGFITAKSATKSDHSFFTVMSGNTTNSTTNATAYVEQLKPGLSKIRLNFVISNKSSSQYGQTSANDQVIEDTNVYESAFNKIGDAIFIRSGS